MSMTGLHMAELVSGLEKLGLTHMAQVAAHRAEEAARTNMGYLDYLHTLVEEELATRYERYVEARTRLAHFPFRNRRVFAQCLPQLIFVGPHVRGGERPESLLTRIGGAAPAGGVFASASRSGSNWRTTLTPASN